MKYHLLMTTAATSIALFAPVAHADTLGGQISGFGGLGYTITSGEDHDGDNGFTAGGFFLDGGARYDLGSGFAYSMVSATHFTDVDEDDPFDADDPGYAYTVSAHYLHQLDSMMHVGGFIAAGQSIPDGDDDDRWDFYGIGAEGHYVFSSTLAGYAQLAIFQADNADGNNDAQGAQSSIVVRGGVNYSLNDATSLYADLQLSDLQDFEDNGESWLWSELSLGGETMINGSNFAVTYDLTFYQTTPLSSGDSDQIFATTASLGVRYYFGGASGTARSRGMIGAPSTFARSSLYPEYHN